MFEETIQKLRDYVHHRGNPKPSSRLAYPLRSDIVRTGKPLTKSQFKQFTNKANAILNSFSNSEAATDNEREARDILRSLWDQYNHPDSIVTRIDTLNFIAWWIRLYRLERHKSKSSSSLLIESSLNREVDDQIKTLRVLTKEFREKALELESRSPTLEEVFEVYKLLNFLDSESDLPPQVLTEDQASKLVEYLTACEVQASRVAERISLIQGRVPLLRNLIMSVKLDKFWETLASFSRADITESTRQRETAFQTATPNGSSNSVVQQFLSAAKSIPYIDEPYSFHALVHFSRPFGHLQRREGDVIGDFYANKLDIFTNLLERHSVHKMRGLCSTIVNFREGKSELAALPFGYLYNLENHFNRNSMLGSRQSSYGNDLEMVFHDKKQFIRECAAGEIHAFCHSVANEMNSRYAFKYGERYYKWIGFIASLDQIDVMLNVVGYLDSDLSPTDSNVLHDPGRSKLVTVPGTSNDSEAAAKSAAPNLSQLVLPTDLFAARDKLVEDDEYWSIAKPFILDRVKHYVSMTAKEDLSVTLAAAMKNSGWHPVISFLVNRGIVYVVIKAERNKHKAGKRLGFYNRVSDEVFDKLFGPEVKKGEKQKDHPEVEKALDNFSAFLVRKCGFESSEIANFEETGRYSNDELEYIALTAKLTP